MTLLALQRTRGKFGPPRARRVGQVATYLVVWTAILVLLTVVLMNIGQLAMVRTATANAADAAALSLASSLGAAARYHCEQLDPSGRCETQCSDHAEFTLNIFLGIIMIVIGIILCILSVFTAGALCVAGVALIIAGVAQLVVTSIKAGAITPHQIALFNERMQELSEHDALREATILAAFIQLVDDRRQEPDSEPNFKRASDIDRDGDEAEMVGAFAKWFNRRLIQMDNELERDRKAIRRFVINVLMNFRRESDGFRGWLQWEFIPILEWIERDADPAAPWDVAWWTAGKQLPNLNTYPGNGTRTPSCVPGVTCPVREPQLPDDVDWMLGEGTRITARGDKEILDGTPRAFETWVRTLVRCEPGNQAQCKDPVGMFDPRNFNIRRRTVKNLGTWRFLMQGYWMNQAAYWRTLTEKWIADLTGVYQAMCVRWPATSCLPPGGGMPGVSGHPIEAAITRLRAFQGQIDALTTETTAFVPRHISKDRPIYRWHDERGWHYVRVEVGEFEVPHPEAAQNLVYGWEDPLSCGWLGGCLENCVAIEAKQGNVAVKVTRFDQDRLVTRGFPFRMRDVPDDTGTRPPPGADTTSWGVVSAGVYDFDLANADPVYMNRMLDKYGVISTGRARYSWKPRSVQMTGAR